MCIYIIEMLYYIYRDLYLLEMDITYNYYIGNKKIYQNRCIENLPACTFYMGLDLVNYNTNFLVCQFFLVRIHVLLDFDFVHFLETPEVMLINLRFWNIICYLRYQISSNNDCFKQMNGLSQST